MAQRNPLVQIVFRQIPTPNQGELMELKDAIITAHALEQIIRRQVSVVRAEKNCTARTILDYDADGNLIGLEILDASKRVDEARSMQFQVAG